MTLPEESTKKSAILSQLDAEQEIQKFVKAVSSYPAHFASNPGITFEEHLLHVIEDARRMPGEQDSEGI
jgi:hypothetical protein